MFAEASKLNPQAHRPTSCALNRCENCFVMNNNHAKFSSEIAGCLCGTSQILKGKHACHTLEWLSSSFHFFMIGQNSTIKSPLANSFHTKLYLVWYGVSKGVRVNFAGQEIFFTKTLTTTRGLIWRPPEQFQELHERINVSICPTGTFPSSNPTTVS